MEHKLVVFEQQEKEAIIGAINAARAA